ncbi:hypothetical protein A9Z06_26675 [Rhizobium sp. YK2]|nr:hypothetical protein A9Z06_26675 [Rhizobium sp. YK2]
MRTRHGNLKIHAVAGQAICRTPIVGAAFSINFRPRHPFPSKARVAFKNEKPVDLTGLAHCGRGSRKITFA